MESGLHRALRLQRFFQQVCAEPFLPVPAATFLLPGEANLGAGRSQDLGGLPWALALGSITHLMNDLGQETKPKCASWHLPHRAV